jgi:nitroreductase
VETWLAIASKRDHRDYAATPIPPDVERRILDAGRVSGSSRNTQKWQFVVVEQAKQELSKAVYAPGNVATAALVIALVGDAAGFDVGRASQNMMLAAWDEGVVSCPNGMPDPAETADALGLEGDLLPVTVLSFGYPRRDLAPESKTAEEWSAEANRLPLDELVTRR